MSISILLQPKLLPYVIYLLFFLLIQYWINPREDNELSRKWQFEYSDNAISFLSFLSFFSFKYHSIPIMRATWFKRIFLFNQARYRWFDRTTRLQTSSSFFHRNEIVELLEIAIFAISVIEELLICIWIEYSISNYFHMLTSW